MADRGVSPVRGEFTQDPISAIARAEKAARVGDDQTAPMVFDTGPDLVDPSRPLAPQGLASVVDQALGQVQLPTLLELANALDDISDSADAMAEIDPAMSSVAKAVIEDEQRKIMRYLDLRDQ